MAARAAVVAAGAFAVGYLVTALVFFGGGPDGPVVTVPDVRELTVPDARRALDRYGLELHLADSLPNARVERGSVLAQSPLPGQEVAPLSQVRVILSLGPERRAVPRVDGYPPAQAERILAASGFQVEVRSVPAPSEPGRVVGTDPAAGAAVPLPATVHLLVSAGPPLVAAPAVVGMLEGDALVALAAAGLHVGDVGYDLRSDLDDGLVLSQFPAAGDSVPAGSAVTLQVATREPRPDPLPAPGAEPEPQPDPPPAEPEGELPRPAEEEEIE